MGANQVLLRSSHIGLHNLFVEYSLGGKRWITTSFSMQLHFQALSLQISNKDGIAFSLSLQILH